MRKRARGRRRKRESSRFVPAINNNASTTRSTSPIFPAPTVIFFASISLFLFEAPLHATSGTQQQHQPLHSRVNEFTAQLAIIRTKMIHGSYSECNKGCQRMDANTRLHAHESSSALFRRK